MTIATFSIRRARRISSTSRWAALGALALALAEVACNVGDSSTLDDTYARPCGKGKGPGHWDCPDASTSTADAAPPAPMPDAAPPPMMADAAPAPMPDAAPPPSNCDPAVTPATNGHHNPGKDCHGCHDGSRSAPLWTVSGTLYDSVSGANPVAGATLHITDARGQSLTLITQGNGNFYTGTPVTYPLTVSGSQCPYNVAMSGTVPAPASCNAAGCHASGFRIHLP